MLIQGKLKKRFKLLNLEKYQLCCKVTSDFLSQKTVSSSSNKTRVVSLDPRDVQIPQAFIIFLIGWARYAWETGAFRQFITHAVFFSTD